MKTNYLFYGFGSEYVLHDLFVKMNEKFSCLEIDAYKIKDSKKQIENLIGQAIVLITSAHFFIDDKFLKKYYKSNEYNPFYSVLEVISLLQPKKCIYMPHDLMFPVKDSEINYLNQFDLFLSPCEPYTTAYSKYCSTVEVGWIKFQPTKNKIKPRDRAIWFISDFILHIKMGKEESFEMVAPILKQKVSLKFPVWKGSEEFTAYYRERGADVYDAATSTYDLINAHDTIITNGLSSLIAESYLLGKTTINITENSWYGINGQLMIKTNYPEVIFFDKISDVSIDNIMPTNSKKILSHFNINKTIKLITTT